MEVIQGAPEGVPIKGYPTAEEEFAPGISEEEFKEIARRLNIAGNIHE